MTSSKKKVLVTGASGLIGGLVTKNLASKYDFSALNRRPIEGIPCTQGDIAEFKYLVITHRRFFLPARTLLSLSITSGRVTRPAHTSR